jgi:hypothetical protein
MEASPSLLGQLEVGTVQAVSVCIPPLTLWISSSLNERAPLRASTLFWSFMLFSFRYFWLHYADPTQQKALPACEERPLGLTQQAVSISARRAPGDYVGLGEPSTNTLDFLRIQLTSAPAK